MHVPCVPYIKYIQRVPKHYGTFLSTRSMETQYFKHCHYIPVYAEALSCKLTIVVKLYALYYGLDTGTVTWTLK